jgi:hypothetical protein
MWQYVVTLYTYTGIPNTHTITLLAGEKSTPSNFMIRAVYKLIELELVVNQC